jgi:acyl-CoA thioesterase
MVNASIFQASDFDLLSTGVYSQELSYLQHKLEVSSIDRVITIKGEFDRHFRLDKADRNADGEVAGWWYEEIGGMGKVLIIND